MLKIDLFTITSKEPYSTEERKHTFSFEDAKTELVGFFEEHKDQYRMFKEAFFILLLTEPAFIRTREKLNIETESKMDLFFEDYDDKQLFVWLLDNFKLELLNEIGAFISLFGMSFKLTHDTAAMKPNVPIFVEAELYSISVNCFADTNVTYEMVNSFNYLFHSKKAFIDGLTDVFIEIAAEHCLWIDYLIAQMDESDHVSRVFKNHCIDNIASAQTFFKNFEEKGKERRIAYAEWIAEHFHIPTLFKEGIIEEMTETKITITKKAAKFS